MRQNTRPLARLRERFPLAVQANRAAFEVLLDDNSKVLFLPLHAGGFALQVWRAGMARDGHGFLLSGSALLGEDDIDQLIDALVLRRRVA
jgi:hypothetical protein